jgi:phosphatidylglycerophosphatase A
VRLWIAQGFGVGRIPFAPGTFGSVVGILWFAALLAPGRLWILLLGTAVGLAASVWLCSYAERTLGTKDPGSVVLDEIAALPVCFYSWLAVQSGRTGSLPGVAEVFTGRNWWWVVAIFLGFRLFDILKPWPVRQSQDLAGGWGVTVDDLLAALYVSLVVLAIFGLQRLMAR